MEDIVRELILFYYKSKLVDNVYNSRGNTVHKLFRNAEVIRVYKQLRVKVSVSFLSQPLGLYEFTCLTTLTE